MPRRALALALALPLLASACATAPAAPCPSCPDAPAAPAPPAAPTPEDARRFVAEANARLHDLNGRLEMSGFIKATYINADTERIAAGIMAEQMAFLSKAIPEAARYRDLPLDPETQRFLTLLRTSTTLPAPADPAQRDELAALSTRLEGHYGEAKHCPTPATCRDLGQLSETLATSKDWDTLVATWTGWHDTAAPSRPGYQRFVALGNAGARELGFADLGELWRSGYDMPPDAFTAEIDRLWGQVRPLYEKLHCYVGRKLQERWGAARVPSGQPLPAHVFGNMWSQDWSALYPLVAPHPKARALDLSKALAKRKTDAPQMVRYGEAFFTSLGHPQLPATFWERSMLVKPRDREVVCHASAWDATHEGDVRIKMCIQPTEDDFVTVHHELGHIYYYLAYNHLPELYQNGANDGFHEAIGDAIALSVTPGYLAELGLAPAGAVDERAMLNEQMRRALDKVAFLPFGRVIDQWRWEVFSGKIAPEAYNGAWWDLRRRYQGVVPPVERTERDFDAGAKYHVPGNTPYMRYFLAAILQFQFHRALCKAAGHEGPLYTCSIYGNKAAGERLWALLQLGASRPWQDALEALTGEREMDATAILDYFAPLSAWLDQQNAGHTCGW